jgi:transcriptional regulator with XRE-family HTH domain
VRVTRRTEYEILGQVIKAAREELGLTQRALARQAGRTETSMHKIEAGDQRVDLVELGDIAQALRITLSEFTARYEAAIERQR